MREEKLYGVHPVLTALEEGRRYIRKVLLDAERHKPTTQRIAALAAQRGIPVEIVERVHLRRILGHDRHQGVVALGEALDSQTFRGVLARLSAVQGAQTVLCLDGVTDVGNFAALTRSAVAFGVEVILLPRRRSVALTPTVAKRSAGAIDRVAVVQVTNIAHTFDALKHAGFWVYGADMLADIPLGQTTWPERVVLVLGREDHGLRRLVRERCDGLVRIPMRPGVDSLNVAMAGTIILAHIWDQRVASDNWV